MMKKLIALIMALCLMVPAFALGEELIMATNAAFAPYEYYENEKIVGIDAEIAAAIAEKLGMTLRIDDVDFNAIIPAVTSGKASIGMAGMTVTEERKQSVNFSDTYATGIQVIIVKEGSPITNIDDVLAEGASYHVGVQEATTGDIYISGDLGDAANERVQKYANGSLAVEALKTDKVDCVIIDNEPAKALAAANDGLKILEASYTEEDYAIAVALENTELLEKINAALKELTEDGTIPAIIAKYIPAE